MGHILRAAKKGAHFTHRILRKASPVYNKAIGDHEKRKKLRAQRKNGKRLKSDYRGRHQ